MFVRYFDGDLEYSYECQPKKGFEYGVEISLWDNDDFTEMEINDFIFPFIAWLVETYSYDPERYEPCFDDESSTAFVYFRDDEDRAAFKLIWGENPSEWDDKNNRYKKEGVSVDTVLHR